MNPNTPFQNPFKPGAGHMPPYLSGRSNETEQFKNLLKQDVILKNMILTGLRGVGKTVLLDTFKPTAISQKWLWVGSDMTESTSITEQTMAVRLLTDLSVITSAFILKEENVRSFGFSAQTISKAQSLNYEKLLELYTSIPGLVVDKLKGILELSWSVIKTRDVKGIIFAYDEAQAISDHPDKEQYPLSLLLNLFQSIQKKGVPFMLLLVGLPPLFPKLVDAKTFAERMFTVVPLYRLGESDSKDAIVKPIEDKKCPVKFTDESVRLTIKESGGYPYFIQYICKEVFDIVIQKVGDRKQPHVPMEEITRKLDKDFFVGRWAKATDRQRDLLFIISDLKNCDEEFTVQDIVDVSQKSKNPFTNSHVNQMLVTLTEHGLVYKNRYGKYSFAVPLLGRFIRRQRKEIEPSEEII